MLSVSPSEHSPAPPYSLRPSRLATIDEEYEGLEVQWWYIMIILVTFLHLL
jgi:hypothetical protein